MPKRTNHFQKLVKLIQQALAPKNATITESAMEPMQGIDGFREIDVLIEPESTSMKIAVEAKDLGRKLNVIDIESFIGKYRGPGRVAVDNVVIVAHTGFSKNAFAKGKMAGFQLLTLKEAKEADWERNASARPQTPIDLSQKIATITFEPPLPAEIANIALSEGRIICNCEKCRGKDIGDPRKVAANNLLREILTRQELQEQIRRKIKKGELVKPKIELNCINYVLRIAGKDYPLEKLIAETEEIDPVALPQFPPASMQFNINRGLQFGVDLHPPVQINDRPSLLREGLLVCKRCGRKLGHIICYAERFLKNELPKRWPNLIKDIMTRSVGTNENTCTKITIPFKNHEIRYQGKIFPIDEMIIHLHTSGSSGEMRFKTFDLVGESVMHKGIHCGEAMIGGNKVQIVLPEGLASKKIAIDICNEGKNNH